MYSHIYIYSGKYHDEVKRQTVTFAEWARRGDANPIAYEGFTKTLVLRIRYVYIGLCTHMSMYKHRIYLIVVLYI